MSDHTKNNGSSSNQHDEFERDLALTSRVYKGTEMDLPSNAMDDAIRAAARRTVKSKPHTVNKSWISRWSTPLSAAALVVLSVSVGLIAIDEQPDLAPASLKEVARPKTALPPAALSTPAPATPSIPAPAAPPMPAPESAAPSAVVAAELPQPARASEKKVRLDLRSVAPSDQVTESAKPALERRRNEADGTVSGNLLAKDSNRAVASPADGPFVPAPPLAELAARQESASQSTTETAKREALQIKQLVPLAASTAIAARGDAGSTTLQKSVSAAAPAAAPAPSIVAGRAAIAPPVYAAPATPAASAAPSSLADKANEPPDVWMKRILELKRLERTREFEDELARFRKRYPDFAMPAELKAPQ